MKITIDTTHDSTEDIEKAIAMLRHLIGEKDAFASPEPLLQQGNAGTDLFTSLLKEENQEQQMPTETSQPEPKKAKDEELFSDLFSDEDVPAEGKSAPPSDEEGYAHRKPKIELY